MLRCNTPHNGSSRFYSAHRTKNPRKTKHSRGGLPSHRNTSGLQSFPHHNIARRLAASFPHVQQTSTQQSTQTSFEYSTTADRTLILGKSTAVSSYSSSQKYSRHSVGNANALGSSPSTRRRIQDTRENISSSSLSASSPQMFSPDGMTSIPLFEDKVTPYANIGRLQPFSFSRLHNGVVSPYGLPSLSHHAALADELFTDHQSLVDEFRQVLADAKKGREFVAATENNTTNELHVLYLTITKLWNEIQTFWSFVYNNTVNKHDQSFEQLASPNTPNLPLMMQYHPLYKQYLQEQIQSDSLSSTPPSSQVDNDLNQSDKDNSSQSGELLQDSHLFLSNMHHSKSPDSRTYRQIMTSLQNNLASFPNILNVLTSLLHQESIIESRRQIASAYLSMLNQNATPVQGHLFGSVVTGLATPNADCDISLSKISLRSHVTTPQIISSVSDVQQLLSQMDHSGLSSMTWDEDNVYNASFNSPSRKSWYQEQNEQKLQHLETKNNNLQSIINQHLEDINPQEGASPSKDEQIHQNTSNQIIASSTASFSSFSEALSWSGESFSSTDSYGIQHSFCQFQGETHQALFQLQQLIERLGNHATLAEIDSSVPLWEPQRAKASLTTIEQILLASEMHKQLLEEKEQLGIENGISTSAGEADEIDFENDTNHFDNQDDEDNADYDNIDDDIDLENAQFRHEGHERHDNSKNLVQNALRRDQILSDDTPDTVSSQIVSLSPTAKHIVRRHNEFNDVAHLYSTSRSIRVGQPSLQYIPGSKHQLGSTHDDSIQFDISAHPNASLVLSPVTFRPRWRAEIITGQSGRIENVVLPPSTFSFISKHSLSTNVGNELATADVPFDPYDVSLENEPSFQPPTPPKAISIQLPTPFFPCQDHPNTVDRVAYETRSQAAAALFRTLRGLGIDCRKTPPLSRRLRTPLVKIQHNEHSNRALIQPVRGWYNNIYINWLNHFQTSINSHRGRVITALYQRSFILRKLQNEAHQSQRLQVHDEQPSPVQVPVFNALGFPPLPALHPQTKSSLWLQGSELFPISDVSLFLASSNFSLKKFNLTQNLIDSHLEQQPAHQPDLHAHRRQPLFSVSSSTMENLLTQTLSSRIRTTPFALSLNSVIHNRHAGLNRNIWLHIKSQILPVSCEASTIDVSNGMIIDPNLTLHESQTICTTSDEAVKIASQNPRLNPLIASELDVLPLQHPNGQNNDPKIDSSLFFSSVWLHPNSLFQQHKSRDKTSSSLLFSSSILRENKLASSEDSNHPEEQSQEPDQLQQSSLPSTPQVDSPFSTFHQTLSDTVFSLFKKPTLNDGSNTTTTNTSQSSPTPSAPSLVKTDLPLARPVSFFSQSISSLSLNDAGLWLAIKYLTAHLLVSHHNISQRSALTLTGITSAQISRIQSYLYSQTTDNDNYKHLLETDPLLPIAEPFIQLPSILPSLSSAQTIASKASPSPSSTEHSSHHEEAPNSALVSPDYDIQGLHALEKPHVFPMPSVHSYSRHLESRLAQDLFTTDSSNIQSRLGQKPNSNLTHAVEQFTSLERDLSHIDNLPAMFTSSKAQFATKHLKNRQLSIFEVASMPAQINLLPQLFAQELVSHIQQHHDQSTSIEEIFQSSQNREESDQDVVDDLPTFFIDKSNGGTKSANPRVKLARKWNMQQCHDQVEQTFIKNVKESISQMAKMAQVYSFHPLKPHSISDPKTTISSANQTNVNSSIVDCDFSFTNDIGMINSALIREYIAIDPRVQPLILLFKQWSQSHQLHGASQQKLSSYAYSLLTIFFLQQKTILPSLQRYMTVAEDSAQVVTESSTSTLHHKQQPPHAPQKAPPVNTKSVQWLFQNTYNGFALSDDFIGYGLRSESLRELTVTDLFQQMLEYYSTFDYTKYVISIRQGKPISKEYKNTYYWPTLHQQRLEARMRDIPTEDLQYLSLHDHTLLNNHFVSPFQRPRNLSPDELKQSFAEEERITAYWDNSNKSKSRNGAAFVPTSYHALTRDDLLCKTTTKHNNLQQEFHNGVPCSASTSSLARNRNPWGFLSIEDPVDLTHDLSRSTSSSFAILFTSQCEHSAAMLQSEPFMDILHHYRDITQSVSSLIEQSAQINYENHQKEYLNVQQNILKIASGEYINFNNPTDSENSQDIAERSQENAVPLSEGSAYVSHNPKPTPPTRQQTEHFSHNWHDFLQNRDNQQSYLAKLRDSSFFSTLAFNDGSDGDDAVSSSSRLANIVNDAAGFHSLSFSAKIPSIAKAYLAVMNTGLVPQQPVAVTDPWDAARTFHHHAYADDQSHSNHNPQQQQNTASTSYTSRSPNSRQKNLFARAADDTSQQNQQYHPETRSESLQSPEYASLQSRFNSRVKSTTQHDHTVTAHAQRRQDAFRYDSTIIQPRHSPSSPPPNHHRSGHSPKASPIARNGPPTGDVSSDEDAPFLSQQIRVPPGSSIRYFPQQQSKKQSPNSADALSQAQSSSDPPPREGKRPSKQKLEHRNPLGPFPSKKKRKKHKTIHSDQD